MQISFKSLLVLSHLLVLPWFLWKIFSGRLEAMMHEARGAWAEAERAYALLLENNPFDQVIVKFTS